MFWRRCWNSISGLFRQLIPYGGPAGLGWPGSCLWWPLLQSCAQIKFFVISLFFQIKWPQKWAIKPAPLTFFPSLKISPIGSYVDVDPEISNSSKLVVISKSEHFAEGHHVGCQCSGLSEQMTEVQPRVVVVYTQPKLPQMDPSSNFLGPLQRYSNLWQVSWSPGRCVWDGTAQDGVYTRFNIKKGLHCSLPTCCG